MLLVSGTNNFADVEVSMQSWLKTNLKRDQFFMTFIASSVPAFVSALMVAGFGFDVFSRSLLRQLLTVFVLWLCLGVFFYAIVSLLAARFVDVRALLKIELRADVALRKIFLAVLFVFPFGLMLFVQFGELINSPIYQKYIEPIGASLLKDGNLWVFLSALIIWLLIIGGSIVFHNRKVWGDIPDAVYIFVIVLAALVLRGLIMTAIRTEPNSDFAVIHEDAMRFAHGLSPQKMYISTHVILIMIYGFLYKIFGINVMVAQIFSLFCYSLAGVFIYLAGKETLGNRFWGFLSGLFLVTWPSLTFYSNVLTPEHPFILIECALLYALALFFKREDMGRWKHNLLWFLLFGLLFGLLSLFRPFSQLFLIAFVITLFLHGRGWKNVFKQGVGLLVLLAVFWFVGTLPGAIASHYHNQFSRTRLCNLWVGVNFDTAGVFNTEDSNKCRKLQAHNPNDADFTKTISGLIVQRISDGRDRIPLLIGQKFAVLWANAAIVLYSVFSDVLETDADNFINIVHRVNLIDFVVTFVVTLACLVGVAIAFFKDVKPVVFFSLLSFFGFNLMEVALEVQTRYRTVVMPLFIFFFVWSLAQIGLLMRERARRKAVLP